MKMTLMKVDGGRFEPHKVNADLMTCHCGGTLEFSLAYGRTPYCFFCPTCTNNYKNNITKSGPEKAIEYYNLYRTDAIQPFQFKIWNYNEHMKKQILR